MQLPNRQNNFDGLRLIASLMVLVSHQFVLSGRSEPLAIGRFTYGTLGVLVFFSLSGYLIAGSWLRDPHLFSFTKKRLLRIWPALAVCVVTLTTICIIAQPDRWRQALEFMTNLIFWHHYGTYFQSNPYSMLNGPLWTIPVELSCYIIFAAIALTAKQHLSWALSVVIFGISILLTIYSETQLRGLAEKMGNPPLGSWEFSLQPHCFALVRS